MATYEWKTNRNGTRRYVRTENVPAPVPKGPQPAVSDSTLRVAPAEAPVVTATVIPAQPAAITKPANVRPASATTITTTTRKAPATPQAKATAKKSDG